MHDYIDFVSGPVPGGFLLLLFLLSALNLTIVFFKKSAVIPAKKLTKIQTVGSAVLLFFYLTLWWILQPPPPPQRIIVLPEQIGENAAQYTKQSFHFPENIQRAAIHNMENAFILHRYEWLMETIGPDSVMNINRWLSLTQKMKSEYIIQPISGEKTRILKIWCLEDEAYCVKELKLHKTAEYSEMASVLNNELSFLKNDSPWEAVSPQYVHYKTLFYSRQYDEILQKSQNDTNFYALKYKGAAHTMKGLKLYRDREKAKFVKINNIHFTKAKNIFQKIVLQKLDDAQVAYWLGRIAIREEDYNKANLFIKKALIEDMSNPRIYYALHFFLPFRLEEIGYRNSVAVLEKALYFDPVYREGVSTLANEYYRSGSGTATTGDTRRAIKLLKKYLSIIENDAYIRSSLASLYLRLGQLSEAEKIYQNIYNESPELSINAYNFGVLYYLQKDFNKAIFYFDKAIQIDENLDAYLYKGIILREQGKLRESLHHFRERVRRKTGSDDKYAVEAMKGIRKVLEELNAPKDSLNAVEIK
jgi:tetratricopeptide (TPR) repeat protein